MNLRHKLRPLLVLAMAWLVAACGEPSPAQLLASARGHIDRQDRAAAIVDLKTLLQLEPASGEARYLLGTLLFDSGDAAGAEAEFRRALQAGFDADKVAPRLAASLMVRRGTDQVIQEFGKTRLKDDKAAAALQVQLAAAHLAKGQLDEADRSLREALQRQPDLADALAMRARLRAARGQPAEALAELDALLARSPDNAPAWLLKGNLLMRDASASGAAAEAALRRALALQPAMAPAHEALISLLITRGDHEAARTQWEAMKKVQPRHPQTLYFEAVLALQRGEGRRALEIAQWLLRGAPDDPALLLIAGRAELLLNALVKAEALLGRAVAKDPRSAAPRRALAEAQLRGGQSARALATLKPLLDAGTEDVDVLTLVADAQLQLGNTAAATALLSRAAAARPGDPRVQTLLGLAQLRDGKVAQAFQALEALAAASDDLQVHLALINARLQRQEFDGALQAIDALAAKRPTSALPDQLRGQLALRRGDRTAARASFEAALAKEADHLPALSQLTTLDLSDGKSAEARARLASAVQRQPANARIRLLLADVAKRTGAPAHEVGSLLEEAVMAQPADAEPHLALVDHLLGTSSAKLALVAAQNAVAALPNQPDLLDRLGRAQLASGEHLQAAASFSRLAGLQPNSALPVLLLAEAQLGGRDPTAALVSLRRAVQLEPKSPGVLQAAARLALRADQPDEALALARSTQTQQPRDALGWLLEGEVALAQQRFDAAAAAFRGALVRDNPGPAVMRLHLALRRAGQTADADRVEADWMRAHPEDAAFAYHLADLALVDRRWDEAETRFRAFVERHPAHVMALNNLAHVLLQQNKPGALAFAERAAKLAPSAPAVLDTLAQAHADGRQFDKAVQAQARAVALSPNAGALRLSLAKLHIAAGDIDKARIELAVLARLGTQFSDQAEVDRLARQVGGVAELVALESTRAAPGAAATGGPVTGTVQRLLAPIAAALAAALALVLSLAAVRPKFFDVRRSLSVQAPADQVFDLLQDLRQWERWADWPPFARTATRSYLGEAPIRTCTWRDERHSAQGSIDILQRIAPERVTAELDVEHPVPLRQLIEFTLTPVPGDDERTTVSCEIRGPLGYGARVLGVVCGVDWRIGRSLMARLKRLKAAADAA